MGYLGDVYHCLRNICWRLFMTVANTVIGAFSVGYAIYLFSLPMFAAIGENAATVFNIFYGSRTWKGWRMKKRLKLKTKRREVKKKPQELKEKMQEWKKKNKKWKNQGRKTWAWVLMVSTLLCVYLYVLVILVVVFYVLSSLSGPWTDQRTNAMEQPPRPPIHSQSCFSDLPGNKLSGSVLLLLLLVVLPATWSASASARPSSKLGRSCRSEAHCGTGLTCCNWNCFTGKKCVRATATNPFSIVDTSLPFNKYAFLTTHNSYSITGVTRFTFYNQEDSVTDQLNNGVRALMLDVYDYDDDIWLCHSAGGKCYGPTSFEPAIFTLREIEVFLLTNPSEIVTLILEDHVTSEYGLSRLFKRTGLGRYWFPVSKMPRNGEDWPCVRDMIKRNHRLLVFTSNRYKELSEGIAYQWNYMVENQYGDDGMNPAVCQNRSESPFLFDRTKSLVLVNYFRTIPLQRTACVEHSRSLITDVLKTCHAAAGNRWANFLAVDYYKRSNGGGAFAATDMLNGRLICQSNDVYDCRTIILILKHAFYDILLKLGLAWKESRLEEHGPFFEAHLETWGELDAAMPRSEARVV